MSPEGKRTSQSARGRNGHPEAADGFAVPGMDKIHGHDVVVISEGVEALLHLVQARDDKEFAEAREHLNLVIDLASDHIKKPVGNEEIISDSEEERKTSKRFLDKLPSGRKMMTSLSWATTIAITGFVIYFGAKGTDSQEKTGDRVNPPTIGTGVESFNQAIEQYHQEIVETGSNQQQIVEEAFSQVDWEQVNANLDSDGVPPAPGYI